MTNLLFENVEDLSLVAVRESELSREHVCRKHSAILMSSTVLPSETWR